MSTIKRTFKCMYLIDQRLYNRLIDNTKLTLSSSNNKIIRRDYVTAPNINNNPTANLNLVASNYSNEVQRKIPTINDVINFKNGDNSVSDEKLPTNAELDNIQPVISEKNSEVLDSHIETTSDNNKIIRRDYVTAPNINNNPTANLNLLAQNYSNEVQHKIPTINDVINF